MIHVIVKLLLSNWPMRFEHHGYSGSSIKEGRPSLLFYSASMVNNSGFVGVPFSVTFLLLLSSVSYGQGIVIYFISSILIYAV